LVLDVRGEGGMKFQVEIPDDAFWKVAEIAERFEMKVPEYAAEAVITAAAGKTLHETDPVVAAWRVGDTDAEIARRLDMTNAAVATRRRSYGLPANRRKKGNTR
jgi:hypothetical protein